MARPKKDEAPDLGVTHELSEDLITRIVCPFGVPKAFLRDKDVTGLKVRVTANGAKAFVYEAKLQGRAISRTLGRFPLMSIEDAKAKARTLATTVKTDKKDPRELERLQAEVEAAAAVANTAQDAATATQQAMQALTLGTVWEAYLIDRRQQWGNTHYEDHIRKAAPGGVATNRGTRGKGFTQPGPLHPFMAIPLRDLTATKIEAWAATEGAIRPTSARLAHRLLKTFLGWCEEQPAYASLMQPKNPAKTTRTRESLGKAGVKSGVLQREQLGVWFAHVRQLGNPTTAAALQVMLLTGVRVNEVLAMRWEDVNMQWRRITIKDKVEGTRMIPATPFVLHLLATLPRRNQWVFSSPTSAAGCLTSPNHPHSQACIAAGLQGLTLHDLRRSFKSLSDWLEIPVGVVAQIMGHKPSATAEKHYTIRSNEQLRGHHERFEAWILEWAGIAFDATATAQPGLRMVAKSAASGISV